MMEFWESAILSNIVGICSLVIGFAGLIITVKTMRSAKRIEEDIKEAQSLALDKSRFRKYKEKASKSLNRKRKAVKEENTISFVDQQFEHQFVQSVQQYLEYSFEVDFSINLLLP